MASWLYITQIYTLYAFFPFCCIGLFGSLMNTIILSTSRMYRTQPCTFFLLIAAIAQSVQYLTAGISRISAIGYNTDLTLLSPAWCKIRAYLIDTCYGVALTCEWLATIDRFLMTSRSANLRQLSKIKWAYCIGAGVVVFWTFTCVPDLIFTYISSNVCGNYNVIWGTYYTYVNHWFFYIIVPLVTVIVFGILAYRNIRTLANTRQLQGADRQLTYMIFGQIILIIISVLPDATFRAYSSASLSVNKTVEQAGIEYFIFNVLNSVANITYGSAFYVFLIVSKTFRQQVKYCFCYFCKNPNNVTPVNTDVIPGSANIK
ncbi:unnamed protein product [Adineta steineri]|uniref:G-protein coupled receptors family 1 profile domain-containing protein n=1 Tax=Adineta steineri TaxID=433720 RepID=A0A813SEV5_9BILA|nr:unnamed protein product [Adineta steineri]CAF0795152.1 unnamed protein product [Adineta steineri]